MLLLVCDVMGLLLEPVTKQDEEKLILRKSKEAELKCWLLLVVTWSWGAGGMLDLRMRVWLSCSP